MIFELFSDIRSIIEKLRVKSFNKIFLNGKEITDYSQKLDDLIDKYTFTYT